MLKNKSPEDINRVSNETLFTELTPKEAAVIEGGSIFELYNVQLLGTTDMRQVCVGVNDTIIWSGSSVGDLADDPIASGSFIGRGRVKLYEQGVTTGSCDQQTSTCGELIASFPVGRNTGPMRGTVNYRPDESGPTLSFVVDGFVTVTG